MTHTANEKLVFNKAIDICFEDSNTSVKELAKVLSLEVDSVKGIIGSLVKKGLVAVDEEERGTKLVQVGKKLKYVPVVFITVYPIVDGKQFGYGWDNYSVEEKESFKLN